MGLLLSVLVACVGVVELFAFYSNVRRSLVTVSTQTSFEDITKRYIEDLERHRSYLLSQIPSDSDEDDESRSDGGKQILTEDNKVEFVNALKRSSPKRFPLDEESDRSRSPSPHLIIAKTNFDNETDVLNVLIKEQSSILGQNSQKHRINHDESLCLTKEFLDTEETPETHSRSPSPIPRRLGDEQEYTFRRSPSPYPPPVLSVPRNSICNELLDASVSVAEVDEEAISRSPTPEKLQVILESKHNSTEYWTNKILVVPPTKTLYYNPLECQASYSNSSCSIKCEQKSFQVVTERKERNEKFSVESVLSRDSDLMTKDENEIEDEIKELDEQFLDSLDGVNKKKLSRNSSLRRSRKKDDCVSSPVQNNDAQTAKTLTEAANVLKNVNQEANGRSEASAGTSKQGDGKTSEPFWVNR